MVKNSKKWNLKTANLNNYLKNSSKWGNGLHNYYFSAKQFFEIPSSTIKRWVLIRWRLFLGWQLRVIGRSDLWVVVSEAGVQLVFDVFGVLASVIGEGVRPVRVMLGHVPTHLVRVPTDLECPTAHVARETHLQRRLVQNTAMPIGPISKRLRVFQGKAQWGRQWNKW